MLFYMVNKACILQMSWSWADFQDMGWMEAWILDLITKCAGICDSGCEGVECIFFDLAKFFFSEYQTIWLVLDGL